MRWAETQIFTALPRTEYLATLEQTHEHVVYKLPACTEFMMDYNIPMKVDWHLHIACFIYQRVQNPQIFGLRTHKTKESSTLSHLRGWN